jgi:hypothetical protein
MSDESPAAAAASAFRFYSLFSSSISYSSSASLVFPILSYGYAISEYIC